MSDRVLVRVLCSRKKGAHVIGRVIATFEGPRLTFALPIHSTAGMVTWQETVLAPSPADGAVVGSEAWCTICKRSHFLTASDVFTAAADGQKVIQLVAEGMYRDPIGVTERARRADPC